MATFDSRCPFCRGKFEAEEEWLGQTAECPSCGKGITVEKPAGEPKKFKLLTQKQPLGLKRDTALKVQDSIPNTAPSQQAVKNFAPPVTNLSNGKVCPSCHHQVSDNAVICVQCGYNLKTGEKLLGADANRESTIEETIPAEFIQTCPQCNKFFQAYKEWIGQTAKCEQCGTEITIEPTKFDYECPLCKERFQTYEECVGKTCKCPRCGKEITIKPPTFLETLGSAILCFIVTGIIGSLGILAALFLIYLLKSRGS